MYMTRINFVNQCIFIDKKVQHGYFYPRMIISKFFFANELFDNTLIDGEMIKDTNDKWVFLIHDIIADSGKVLSQMNLAKRMNRVSELLETQFIEEDLDMCRFEIKGYFHLDDIPKLVSDLIPSLPYTCRGLYFKPLFIKFRDILYNFDDTLIKKVVRTKYKNISTFLLKDSITGPMSTLQETEKMQTDRQSVTTHETKTNISAIVGGVSLTTILNVRKTNQPDVYELYEEDKVTSIGVACVNNMKTSKLLKELFMNKTPNDKIKMTCQFSDKFKKWTPVYTV